MYSEKFYEKIPKTVYETPKTRYNLKNIDDESECNERKWAVYGLVITFLIITLKIFTNYSKSIM